MSKKAFDKFFVANLRRIAQMVNPYIKEKQKLVEEIKKREDRIKVLDEQINNLDGHIRSVSGGYGVEDLIERKVETKINEEGKETKMVKWVLKYPETIVPEKTEEEINPDILATTEEVKEEQKKVDIDSEEFEIN